MSYTSAIFYLDYENGSDAARTALTSCVADNPSGTTTRITKVGHGLVTGAIVDLTLFTAWLNSSWKITRVDDDTFTLDDAVWQATADPNGTVTPFGGMNWTDAWKTITSGATAARIAAGDTIRIAKSPDPVQLSGATGQATWTNLSKTVTLAEAQTANIDLCETAWTANGAGDVTVARTAVATDGKEGSYSMKFTTDAAVQVSIMQAYYATGELDLSAYQKISFWFKNQNAIADANTWKICLCSDVAGATPVDTFYIPAIPSTTQWIPLTLTKDGGGNLGASIKSIALYSDTTAPTASKYIYLDDIIACTTSGLNLQSLISKNSAAQGDVDGWYALQSINGTTVLIDNHTNAKATQGEGYSTTGTSPETVDTYFRETIKTDMAAAAGTIIFQPTESGNAAASISYLGGWNTSTGLQDGETLFDGLSTFGIALNLQSSLYNNYFDYLSFYRYYVAVNFNGANLNTINNISIGHCYYYGLTFGDSNSAHGNRIINLRNCNNNGNNAIVYGTGSLNNSGNIIDACGGCNNNLSHAVYFVNAFDNQIGSIRCMNNGGAGFNFNKPAYGNRVNNVYAIANSADVWIQYGTNYLKNPQLLSGTPYAQATTYANVRLCMTNYNAGDYDRIYTDGGLIVSLATNRVGGTGKMWELSPTSLRSVLYPLDLVVARIACKANKAVTVKAYMKMDNTANVLGGLRVRGGQLTGVASDVTVNMATADTDWHEVTLADFTPTEAGVIEVEALAWYVAGNSNVYIEDCTITQAA